MDEPQILAIFIIVGFFFTTGALVAYMVWRTVSKPGSGIGARARQREEELRARGEFPGQTEPGGPAPGDRPVRRRPEPRPEAPDDGL